VQTGNIFGKRNRFTGEYGDRWWWGVRPADSPGEMQLRLGPDPRRLTSFRLVDQLAMMKPEDQHYSEEQLVPRKSMLALAGTAEVWTGFRNLGNSCWLGSGSQCIANCSSFVNEFASGDFLEDLESVSLGQPRAGPNGDTFPVTRALANMLADLLSGRFICIAPRELRICAARDLRLVDAFQRTQQEPDQFIASLLSQVHEETNCGDPMVVLVFF
jgi:ubiquitin C-terminal hydrolase